MASHNAPCKIAQVHSSMQQLPRPCRPPPHYALPTANSSARSRVLKSTSLSDSSGSTSSSLKPRPRPPKITPIYYPHVADTNPERIARLWKAVMSYIEERPSYIRETDSSKKKDKKSIQPTPNKGVAATKSTTRTVKSTGTTASGITKSEPGAKVTNRDFETSVLERHGITIELDGPPLDPKEHFGLTGLQDFEGRLHTHYKVDDFKDLEVWLAPNIDKVVQAYRYMQNHGSNDAEYSTYALRHIFHDEPLHMSDEQRLAPRQALQLFWKPSKENNWYAPPPISAPRTYGWDLRPDATYFVSRDAFKPEFRSSIGALTSAIREEGICPYLTIEFKKDHHKVSEVARGQVAAFGAMSLYNRYRLKCRTLEALEAAYKGNTKSNWSKENMDQMRHYGVTFAGPKWTVWCIRPKTFPEWTGCTMARIDKGDCTAAQGVASLARNLNDVHYWGLKTHGESVKDDICFRILLDAWMMQRRNSGSFVIRVSIAMSLSLGCLI
ncbi:hypothetical protein F4679DRAFT_569231 [Xylaria curta]|nr:hypothetical protein F4679DRAFT_569231 [Xylaria curta]